jgi:hypothetical protein
MDRRAQGVLRALHRVNTHYRGRRYLICIRISWLDRLGLRKKIEREKLLPKTSLKETHLKVLRINLSNDSRMMKSIKVRRNLTLNSPAAHLSHINYKTSPEISYPTRTIRTNYPKLEQ